MIKSPKMIYLILILTLNFSCVDKKTSETDINKSTLANPSKSDSLKFTSGVHSIFQDIKGNYWLGSHGEGVSRFDGTSFEYFTTNEGLADNHILSIQEDKNGMIWFGTLNGVNSYDGKTIKAHNTSDFLAPQSSWMKTDTDLWFNAGNKEGAYRYDGQKLNYLEFPSAKTNNSGDVYSVTGISKGRNKMLWFATYAGVIGYNGSDFTLINDESLAYTNSGDRVHVRSILEDSKGRLWIGNNGIGVLLKDGKEIVHFSERNNLISATSKRNGDKSEAGTLEHVFAIAEDSNGNIWFGDRDTGAWKYDGESLTNYTIDEELSSQMIWDIYVDRNNKILVGMAFGGVYEFNGKSFYKRF